MIKGFANMRRPDLAMGLLREMRAEGVQLNLVLYNGLIDAQAREGNMEVILELLAEMEKAGLAPDHITRSTVAKGFCMKGDLEKAMDVFRKAPTDEANIVLFNTVLDACARRGNYALGDELLARIGRGVVPTSHTLGLLARFWGRQRQLERAFEAFEELPRRFGFSVDSPAWCSLITACLGVQDIPQACRAFAQMQAAPCGPDRKAFN